MIILKSQLNFLTGLSLGNRAEILKYGSRYGNIDELYKCLGQENSGEYRG